MSSSRSNRHGPDLAALSATLKDADEQLAALRGSLDGDTIAALEARIAQARENLAKLNEAAEFTDFGALGPFWRNIPGVRFADGSSEPSTN